MRESWDRHNVLFVRGSFATLGGAERELIQLLRHAGKKWSIGLATLEWTEDAQQLLGDTEIEIYQPEKPIKWPSGAVAEITAAHSKLAKKTWNHMHIPWEKFHAAHISVCRGSLELTPYIPSGIGIHYHCLEPPRWLYEDVLMKDVHGKRKRPAFVDNFIFSKQRQLDQRYVESLKKFGLRTSTISGNSMYIQHQLKRIYGLKSDPSKKNGQPPTRVELAGLDDATHLMHVLDWDLWPESPDEEELASTVSVEGDYVVTVGKISYVKGTKESITSLIGTGIKLVQIGGGSEADSKAMLDYAASVGVTFIKMPRLSQAELRGLMRNSLAVISHAHNEPFGLTPLEAMAVGVPALAVDEGGFHYTMSPVDSGRLIARDDLAGWKQAYKDIKKPELRERWAKNGRPYVEENFTIDVQLEALHNLIWELTSWEAPEKKLGKVRSDV